jgi:hypothetical protein
MSSPNLPGNRTVIDRLRTLSAPRTRLPDVPYTAWEAVGPPGTVATGDNEAEFQNGWGNLGAPYPPFSFHKSEDGKIYLRGAVYGGAISTVITTLPEYARPEYTERFAVPTSTPGLFATIEIAPSGAVTFTG